MLFKTFAVGAILLVSALPSFSQGTVTLTPTLLWPKNLTYYVKPSRYADVPGHSRHEYTITATGGPVNWIVAVTSILRVHTSTAVSSESNIPVLLSAGLVWNRSDSLWLTTSLSPGSYTSSATNELSHGGSLLSGTDFGSFTVSEAPPPPPSDL
jgi:hypothetical protein